MGLNFQAYFLESESIVLKFQKRNLKLNPTVLLNLRTNQHWFKPLVCKGKHHLPHNSNLGIQVCWLVTMWLYKYPKVAPFFSIDDYNSLNKYY
jgi:hypothetical protein